MYKITIYHYHGESRVFEMQTGYKHLQEIEAQSVNEVAEIAGKIFLTGLNVMMYHVGDNSNTILFIDDKNFKQR
jgi:hypothetical protein